MARKKVKKPSLDQIIAWHKRHNEITDILADLRNLDCDAHATEICELEIERASIEARIAEQD